MRRHPVLLHPHIIGWFVLSPCKEHIIALLEKTINFLWQDVVQLSEEPICTPFVKRFFFPATLAAPPVESCPPDSILFEIECKCNPESCMKPPCLSTLTIAKNGSDVPGFCCPIYDCVDCSNDTLIDGRCPCAPEAVLNLKNQCECVDLEKQLVKWKVHMRPLEMRNPFRYATRNPSP
ncbi:hypothetical protein NQ317_009423 [Molorchus minor]|uniref:Uncharacterized protein n=1 Tax=Molorchus minor TaxID=1323400 RepID=A0ABQ9J8U3_9CUCU|nr:hypothetical protein NQ317_009423 [Molorchus minor]